MLTTIISVVLAILGGLIFKPGEGLSAEGINAIVSSSAIQSSQPEMSFWDIVIGMIPENPITAFAEGNILQIIVFGLFLASVANVNSILPVAFEAFKTNTLTRSPSRYCFLLPRE